MEAGEKFGAYVKLRRVVSRRPRLPRASSLPFRQVVSVGSLAACNAALALLSTWYIVAHTGLNVETDAFFASGALPQFTYLLLSATLLPVLVPLLATRDPERLRADAWLFFLIITGLFGALGAALYATSALWVPVFVPGFSAEAKALTVGLARVQVLSMVLNAAIVTLWAAQHARHRFVWVELSGVLANLAGLLFLYVALPRFGIRAAAWNAVFYNCLKLAFLLPVLGRWRRSAWPSPTVKEAWRLFKPFLPGQAYLRAEPLLDRFLASLGGAGSLSLLYIAQQVYANVTQVTSKALVAPLVPRLAVGAESGDWESFRRVCRTRLLLIALLTALGLLVLVAFGPQMLSHAIGHAGVTVGNVHKLWLVLIALAGAFAGGVSGQVASGAFYAMGDTKTPTKVSAGVYTLYLPLKVLVFLHYGLVGLALTMSTFFVVNFFVQLLLLESKVSRRLSESPHR